MMSYLKLILYALAVLFMVILTTTVALADPALPYDADAIYDWTNCNGTFDSPLCNVTFSCIPIATKINFTLFQEVDAVEDNQVIIQANITQTIDNTVTINNGTLVASIWAYATRVLTGVQWSIFGNWTVFNKASNPNLTITYNYNNTNASTSYELMNVTFRSTDSFGANRTEIYNKDNASYLSNVSIQSITS